MVVVVPWWLQVIYAISRTPNKPIQRMIWSTIAYSYTSHYERRLLVTVSRLSVTVSRLSVTVSNCQTVTDCH
jgi:hypothetical protein